MKLAVGPLTTGTYVGHAVAHKGQYYAVHKDVDSTKVGMSEDKEHEGIKWCLEKVGENRFKAKNSSSNGAVAISSVDNQTIEVAAEDDTEWIIGPTDVDGEYIAYPAHNSSLFVTATGSEPVLKVGSSQSEMTRFNIYRVDHD